MRWRTETAIVVGGGQSGGSTAAIEMVGQRQCTAREGAKVLVVDRDIGTAGNRRSITEEQYRARRRRTLPRRKKLLPPLRNARTRGVRSTYCTIMSELASPVAMRR